MELIIVCARSQRLEDALSLRLLFPQLPLEDLRERLRKAEALPAVNLEGPHREQSARRLGKLIQLLRDRQIECSVHHLIEEGESEADPFTEIDLDLLETVLDGSLPRRNRFADFGNTGT